MYVIKRDGRKDPLDITQVRKQTGPATEGLHNVSYEALEAEASILFRDGIYSTEIQHALINTALDKVDVDAADWTYVAGRLQLYELYHEIKRLYGVSGSGDVYERVPLSKYLAYREDLGNDNIVTTIGSFKDKYSPEEIGELNTHINGKLDLLMNYFSVRTGMDMYFTKNSHGEIIELPQHLHMATAMYLAQNEVDKMGYALKFYEMFSKFEFINSTPTNANARAKKPSTISCLINSVPDSIDGIFDSAHEVAKGSQQGSGWGIDWSWVRSKGSWIENTRGVAGGKIPFMKIYNDISIAVDQKGNRPGAFAIYMSCWDIDIWDFLDLKKKNGEERRRAQDLFTAINTNNLFIERDENEGSWTLFDPYDVPNLLKEDAFGPQFDIYYKEYEEAFKNNPEKFNPYTQTIEAKELMRKMCLTYNDEGMPFQHFIDNTNLKHRRKELGKIRASNLCTEILQALREDDTIVCNLGSINLARVNTPDELKRVTRLAIRALDNSIDLTIYPSEKAKKTQLDRRTTGLGMLGEAEMVANMKIMYGSEEHKVLIDMVYGTISREADKISQELAIEKGSCIIPGWRNAYLLATAPNSTSGIFASTSPSHEAVFDKVWIEETNGRNVKVTAPNINIENFEYYISAYDVDQFVALELTAIRYKHTDQGISHNIYLRPENLKLSTIRLILRHAAKLGVGTTYYMRSKPPANNVVKENTIACFGCAN